jgi:hypothetical protein
MSELTVKEIPIRQGIAFSLIRKKDNQRIADAGMIIMGKDGFAWADFTDETQHHKKEIFARFKKALKQIIQEYGLLKIITPVRSDLINKPKFIDRMGFCKTNDFITVQGIDYCNYVMEVR